MPRGPGYLKATRDFRRIMKEGVCHRSAHFVLYSLKQPVVSERARIGISIAKAAIPLATCRNKLRRIIKETWRLKFAEYTGVDIVLVIRKGSYDKRFNFASEEITHLVNKSIS